MSPAAIRASSSSALSWRTRSAAPSPWPSSGLDLLAELEDPRLEGVLFGLQPEGRLDERRALLGRVADARTLGRELGGDEEAEREERQAEGDLPARDGARTRAGRSSWPGRGAVGGSGAAATTSRTTTMTPDRSATSGGIQTGHVGDRGDRVDGADDRRGRRDSGARRQSAPGRGWRRLAPPSARPVPRRRAPVRRAPAAARPRSAAWP